MLGFFRSKPVASPTEDDRTALQAVRDLNLTLSVQRDDIKALERRFERLQGSFNRMSREVYDELYGEPQDDMDDDVQDLLTAAERRRSNG